MIIDKNNREVFIDNRSEKYTMFLTIAYFIFFPIVAQLTNKNSQHFLTYNNTWYSTSLVSIIFDIGITVLLVYLNARIHNKCVRIIITILYYLGLAFSIVFHIYLNLGIGLSGI
jgi:hypothetical protein